MDIFAGALCAGLPTDLFFSPEGGNEDDLIGKAICRRCPAREPCLDYALRKRIPYGIFGGHTAEERRAMRPRIRVRVCTD